MAKSQSDAATQKLIRENGKLADSNRMLRSECKHLRRKIVVLIEAREIEREFSTDNAIPF